MNCPLTIENLPICECIGLGIIRVVDSASQSFFIATPVPLEAVKRVNILLKGELEMPSVLFLVGQVIEAKTPYLTTSSLPKVGSGSAQMKSRLNIKRKALEDAIAASPQKKSRVDDTFATK